MKPQIDSLFFRRVSVFFALFMVSLWQAYFTSPDWYLFGLFKNSNAPAEITTSLEKIPESPSSQQKQTVQRNPNQENDKQKEWVEVETTSEDLKEMPNKESNKEKHLLEKAKVEEKMSANLVIVNDYIKWSQTEVFVNNERKGILSPSNVSEKLDCNVSTDKFRLNLSLDTGWHDLMFKDAFNGVWRFSVWLKNGECRYFSFNANKERSKDYRNVGLVSFYSRTQKERVVYLNGRNQGYLTLNIAYGEVACGQLGSMSFLLKEGRHEYVVREESWTTNHTSASGWLYVKDGECHLVEIKD